MLTSALSTVALVSAFKKKQADEKKALAALKDKVQSKGFVKTKVGK